MAEPGALVTGMHKEKRDKQREEEAGMWLAEFEPEEMLRKMKREKEEIMEKIRQADRKLHEEMERKRAKEEGMHKEKRDKQREEEAGMWLAEFDPEEKAGMWLAEFDPEEMLRKMKREEEEKMEKIRQADRKLHEEMERKRAKEEDRKWHEEMERRRAREEEARMHAMSPSPSFVGRAGRILFPASPTLKTPDTVVKWAGDIGMFWVVCGFLALFLLLLCFVVFICYCILRYRRTRSPATSSRRQDRTGTLTVSGCKVHLPPRLAQADASIAVKIHCDGLPIDFTPISPVLSCAITPPRHASLEGIEVEMETWATSMEAGVQAYIFRRQPGEEWQLIETASLPTAKRTITFKPAHFSDFVIAVRCTLAMWGVLNCYIDHYLYYNEKGVFTSLTCVSCTKFFEEVNAMKKTEVAEVHHSKGANNETLSFSLRAQEPGDFKFKTDEGCKKDIRVEHLVQEIMKRYQLKRSYAAVIPGSFEGDAQMFFRLSIGDTTLASTPVMVSWPIKIKEAKGSAGQIVIGTMVTGRSTMALTQYDSLSITGATNQRIEPVDESSTCPRLLYLAIAMMGIFVAVFAYLVSL